MKKIILMFLAIMALSMPFSAYAKKVYPDGPLFPVREGGLYGYIDRTGKMIIKPQFVDARDFSEGLARVTIDVFHWGYVDTTGRMVIEPRFDWVENSMKDLQP